jgi:predicted phage terminase large subunit-like protein
MNRLPSKQEIQSAKCRRSFYYFVRTAWRVIEPATFIDNWHIELICRALEHAYRGELPDNNLYINVPPVFGKTLLTAVFFPAWIWANDPTKSFLCVSYSEVLENKAARRMRNLLESPWYQGLFRLELSYDNNSISQYSNTAGGIRYSVGIEGSITGRHADFIIMDDLLSAADSTSEIELDRVNKIYDDVLPSRLSDPKTGVKIIICQRLSTKDIIGHVDSKKEHYEKIVLPMEYEGIRYVSSFPELQDPRQDLGELLWPERLGVKEVLDLKNNMSTLGYSGQYQQRPSPIEGHLFMTKWFAHRIQNVDIIGRIISIDTSYGNTSKSDFSSIIVGEFLSDYRLFIREVYRARMTFPKLIAKIEEMAQTYRYQLKKIVVESKTSGVSVIQALNQSSTIIHDLEDELGMLRNTMVVGVAPTVNKIDRAAMISQLCEKKMVLLPPPGPEYPWLFDFETELFNFPAGSFDDSVDAFSQLIQFCGPKLAIGLQARSNVI